MNLLTTATFYLQNASPKAVLKDFSWGCKFLYLRIRYNKVAKTIKNFSEYIKKALIFKTIYITHPNS